MNTRPITFYFNNVDVVAICIFTTREGSWESLPISPVIIKTLNQSQKLPTCRFLFQPRGKKCLAMRAQESCGDEVYDLLPTRSFTVIHSKVAYFFFPLFPFSFISWSGKLYFVSSSSKLKPSSLLFY